MLGTVFIATLLFLIGYICGRLFSKKIGIILAIIFTILIFLITFQLGAFSLGADSSEFGSELLKTAIIASTITFFSIFFGTLVGSFFKNK